MFSAGDGTLGSCTTGKCPEFKSGISARCSLVDMEKKGGSTIWANFLKAIKYNPASGEVKEQCDAFFLGKSAKLPPPAMGKGAFRQFYTMSHLKEYAPPALPSLADVEKEMAKPAPKTAKECNDKGEILKGDVCESCPASKPFDKATKTCKAPPTPSSEVDEHMFVLGVLYQYSGSGWVNGGGNGFSEGAMSYMGDLGGKGGGVDHQVSLRIGGKRRLLQMGEDAQHAGLFINYGAEVGVPISSRIYSSNGSVDSEPKAGFRGTLFAEVEGVFPVAKVLSLVLRTGLQFGGEYFNFASSSTGPTSGGRGILGVPLGFGLQFNFPMTSDISYLRVMGNVFFDIPIDGFSKRSILPATDSDVNGHQGQVGGGIGGGVGLELGF